MTARRRPASAQPATPGQIGAITALLPGAWLTPRIAARLGQITAGQIAVSRVTAADIAAWLAYPPPIMTRTTTTATAAGPPALTRGTETP